MVNLSHQIIHIVGFIAMFGISVSFACSGDRIEACKKHIEGFGEDIQPSPEMCKALGKVIECFERETSSCGESFKTMLKSALIALTSAEEACHNPNLGMEEALGIEGCNVDAFQQCANGFKQNAQLSSSDPAKGCRLLGDARKCIEDFVKGCDSEFISSMTTSQMEVIEQQEQICQTHGYAIDGTGSSSSSGSTSSSSNSNGAEVDIHTSNSEDKSGYKSDNDNNNNDDDNSNNNSNMDGNGNGDGGCGSVQPMYFTLVASGAAILSYILLVL